METPFAPGVRVVHPDFGPGEVVREPSISIKFDGRDLAIRTVLADVELEVVQGLNLCSLCQTEIDLNGLARTNFMYKGRLYHQECYKSIRRMNRRI